MPSAPADRPDLPSPSNGAAQVFSDDATLAEILAYSAPTRRTRRARTSRSLGNSDGDHDILDIYLHEVSRTPLLTQAQEIAVARRIRAGDELAMQELVQRNLMSGAMPEVVYGKMEPALSAYHTAINERLAAGGP